MALKARKARAVRRRFDDDALMSAPLAADDVRSSWTEPTGAAWRTRGSPGAHRTGVRGRRDSTRFNDGSGDGRLRARHTEDVSTPTASGRGPCQPLTLIAPPATGRSGCRTPRRDRWVSENGACAA